MADSTTGLGVPGEQPQGRLTGPQGAAQCLVSRRRSWSHMDTHSQAASFTRRAPGTLVPCDMPALLGLLQQSTVSAPCPPTPQLGTARPLPASLSPSRPLSPSLLLDSRLLRWPHFWPPHQEAGLPCASFCPPSSFRIVFSGDAQAIPRHHLLPSYTPVTSMIPRPPLPHQRR